VLTAVVVDNGEPLIDRSIKSLRDQTLKPRILLCGGPKTDFEKARTLADQVIGPLDGIGKARVQGILEAETDNIVTADSDSLYAPNYCELAEQDLKNLHAVRAGIILPHEWTDPLTLLETSLAWTQPYEFAFAFRKQSFLNTRIQEEDYSYYRTDIGVALQRRLLPILDPRMVVYTRFPTRGAQIASDYLPSMIGGSAPLLALAGIRLLTAL